MARPSAPLETDKEESLFMPKDQPPDRARSKASERSASGSRLRETAESMAPKQKDISVSEFFAKNRHLLGFDNPRKALLDHGQRSGG